MIEFIKQGGVIVDEVLEANPGVHAGNAGLAAALTPRNESDHVPTSRGAFANKGSAAVAIAGILAVSTGAYFGFMQSQPLAQSNLSCFFEGIPDGGLASFIAHDR